MKKFTSASAEKRRSDFGTKMSWTKKHLLDIESLTADEIITSARQAKAFKAVGERAIKKVPAFARQDGRQPVHRTVHAQRAHQLELAHSG